MTTQWTGGGETNTAYDAVLKDFYDGAIKSHLNNKVGVLKLVEKSTRKFQGRRVVWPVHTGRNTGVGARSETGNATNTASTLP